MITFVEKFKGLAHADKIQSVNLGLTVLTILITCFTASISFFGYKIAKAEEIRNQREWSMQQAEYRESLWKELGKVESGIIKDTRALGGKIGVYVGASATVLDEIEKLHQLNETFKLDTQNVKLQTDYLKFISAYADLKSSVEMVSIKYDDSVLIYDPLVKVIGVKGWNYYLDQKNNIRKWQNKLLENYSNTFNLLHSVVKNGRLPNDFENKIKDYGFKMGYALRNLGPPSLAGLDKLKSLNFPGNEKKAN